MPKRIQLPNGSWITVPDMDPYLQQLDARDLARYYFGPEEEEEEEDGGTLAGSAWEGIKSIPSGVADLFYSGLQASIGVATPFADLPVEKRLRQQASKRARERDPAYQDAFLPAVGTGLGQVAGLSALSRLPGGWYAAVGAGVGMGISDQTRRIADYEQKTGTDVPWYKESAAHVMGALIGLSEVVPIKFGMFPAPVATMMNRMKAGLSPNSLRHASKLERTFGFRGALGMGLQEATQEASAQWLQALSARGLYDPDAMQDIARSMAEDFKVGGVVGGIAKLAQHQILGAKFRRFNLDHSLEAAVRDSRARLDEITRGLHGDMTGITEELPDILKDLGVETKVAGDINSIFGGEWASIPYGMDTLLESGRVRRADVESLVIELQRRTNHAKFELDELIKLRPDSLQKYEKAKTALDVMTADRIKRLRRTITELRGGLGEMGGLTGNEQYQKARQADLESDTGATRETVVGVHETRRYARQNPDDPKIAGIMPSFRGAIRSLLGGWFGIGGYYQMAEDLGVHGGPGTEQIQLGVNEDLEFSNLGLASSDRGSFDSVELGGVIFGGRGDHGTSTDQRTVDKSDVMDSLEFADFIEQASIDPQHRTKGLQVPQIRKTLDSLEQSIEKLEQLNDDLYKKHPFTRELSEIQEGKEYADDKSWIEQRNTNQEIIFKQIQRNNAEISRINRERGLIYLRLLSQRLQQARTHFKNNSKDKAKAAKRVLGKTDIEGFDTWLDGTIAAVLQSEVNGRRMTKFAEEERVKFVADMAAQTDVSEETKAALEVQFLSENAARFIRLPRDISAPQFVKIADLFIDDPKDPKGAIQGALATKAIKDISRWQVENALYEVTADGLPSVDRTEPVVEGFVDKLGNLISDKAGKVSLEDGRREYISDNDIIELLRSKNIHLRDGKRIGKSLAKRTGAGVESRPFEKLLFDMTGALNWEGATYAQRLLMYSRLLQLPAHYKSRGNPEEQLYLKEQGQEDYRPLFLPDFYNNPSIDSHIDFMTDRVVEITEEGHHQWPNLTIGQLRADTSEGLGKDNFNSESFDEALARLIETGVFNPTDSAAPSVILSPDTWWTAPTDEGQIEMGLGDTTVEVPTRATWVNLLNNYGIEGKNPQFPWGTIPDSELSGTKEEKLGEKWTPVIKEIFPEVSENTDVEFVKADDPRLINDKGRVATARHLKNPEGKNRIIISYGKVQELFRRAKGKKKLSVKRQDVNVEKYLRYVKDINKEFLDADEMLVFVLAHEMAHEQFPAQEAGVIPRPDPAAVMPPDARVAMKFKDGAMGMNMREGLEGKTTMELIEEGVRTGTSRRNKDIDANVGDVVEFYDGTGKTVRAKITKGWTKLDQIDPGYWSQIEGWDVAAHNKLADAGYWQYEYELIPGADESRAAYENQINESGLAELNRYMKGRAEALYETRKMEDNSRESERLPTAVSNSTVRFNVNYKPLEAPWAPTTEGMTQPGDVRVQNAEFWVGESRPELVRKLLADPKATWASQVDDMWASYNEKSTDKPISKKEYIKRYTALITSTIPLQELSDLGILDTVQGAVVMPGEMAPAENILELGTAEGRSLVQGLMKSGAIPSSLQDNVHALRRRFIDTMKTRFEVLDKNVEEVIKTLRLPDNIQRQYVDDVDGMYQFLSDVAIGGKRMEGVRALYDRPGNRIIINLAVVDPNNMISAQEVVKDAAFHEGLHALIIRDHLTDEELKTLYNFVRNEENIVPKEINQDAHDAKLTWFELAVVEHKDTGLAEADIEKEAVISLLQNMVRHPGAYVAGKKTRKIGDDIGRFLEKFVGAAKDADIVDVMKILGRIERGEVGERGSGYGFLEGDEYTADSMIRSNDLLRYANPEDIKELRAAIILRDAAPSGQMRESEQAKVDVIADKITANRDIIQGSAGPIPDEAMAIQDEREKIEHVRATATGSVPLLGLDHGKKDPEAYKLALNTFMEMRGKDPRYAYKMPAEYQTSLFNNKSKSSSEAQDTVSEWVEAGHIVPIDKDTTRKSLESGPLNPDSNTGDTVEATENNLDKSVNNLRYLYLDRRQWVVAQTDKLLAAQNRAQLDAETSALVMWRNSDNALNWLPGLMLRGPLSFLGTSVGSGKFENAPIYDNDLQEIYGGDGRVQGLNEIFAPIIDSKDQEVAMTYGMAKRILWTKKRRDSLRSATDGILRADLDPSVRLKLEKFEEAYEAINSKDKLSDDQLNKAIRQVETNESNKFIIEFWDRYNAYDNHMIKMSYNTGMITREVRDEWLSMPFAPFYREVATDEDFPIGSREEIAKRGINLVEKALKGSAEPIKTSLADGVISNTQALVRDAMMNVAVSRTVRDAVALGDAKKINISGMAGSLDNRVVRVMEEGVPVFYEFKDAQLAMSTMMLGFNPKKQLQELFGERKLGELTQKALTNASTLLRESVTRTPPFAIKNVFRDSWNAMNLTGGGPELVLEAFRNAFDADVLRRADEAGLSIGIDFVAEPGEYGNKMQKELDKANPDWRKPLTPLAVLWNFTGRIAKQSEVATRLAVYDRVLAMTGDKSLAQYYAIEIMNYGRRGASATLSTYMATVPFMNGRLQGLDVTYRGLRGKKGSSDIPGVYGYGLTADEYEGLPMWQKSRGLVLGRGLLLTAATSALYFLMRDDDEWQDLRDEVKADNWVLPLSDHAWLKIPIPFELGVIFKVIPEKILEAIVEKDVGAVDVGEEVWRQLRTSLSIGGPQLFTPVVNAMRNYDTFRKDAIVDHWMEETLSANEQRNMYTSNVARGVADLANSIPLVKNLDFLTSPMKVEYMMRQYVGTMGGYVITVADRMARTGILPDLPFDPYMNLAEAENVIGTNKDFDLKSMIGGEGVANVPILGDLLTDPRTRGGRQQQFFKAIEELDDTIATLNSINARDRQKGFAYRDKHANILRHQYQLRFIQNQLRKWREGREHLAKIPRESMSDDEKREYYERLREGQQYILRGIDDLMISIKEG